MHSLKENSTQVVLLSALRRGISESGTYAGTAVDTKGEARKVLVILSVGAVCTNTLTLLIEESVDNTTFTTNYAFTAKASTGAVVVDLTVGARYVRAYATLAATGGVSYVDFGVVGVFYNERFRPSNVA